MNPWNQIHTLPQVDVLIDVGVGRNTNFLYDAFPSAELVLVDPINDVKDVDRPYTFYQYAASNKTGLTTMYIDLDSINMCSIYDRTSLTKGKRIKEIVVEQTTLDSIIPIEDKTYGLKIDTEGADLDVLLGATEVLKKCSWVICEVSVLERFVNSYKFEDIILFMKEHNFKVACVLSANPDSQGNIRYLNLGFERA